MNLNKEIGRILKEIRISKGMSVQYLSCKLDIDQDTLLDYENGKRIGSTVLEKICDILEVDKINVLEKAKLNAKYVIGDKKNLNKEELVIKFLEEKNEYELIELYKEIIENNSLMILLDEDKDLSVEEVYQILKIIRDLD
ncbi:helix-turn-helix domain-containing protein [Candidatus Stoquefichus sp. SB1]|uniref:helix-turn-helix domain-containing protein n=1 Tax=Candidatus Stoquefichus sp. SB1 TaxID=1658109 RepID=UPI00067EF0BD|nr:helix-turn-helix transcriptional regulator [Candidatus Stoquefichus sp. SB1]